jgi:superoxide dismutase, Cu-Zn family
MNPFHQGILVAFAWGLVFAPSNLSADQALNAARIAKAEIEESRPVIPIKKAVAALNPTKGNHVQGVVNFTEVEGGIHITATIEGLTPGKHGFHIHEFGDCSAPDGSSAGGHFNPTNQKHGGPDHLERHAGDLGNIVADAFGIAHYDRVDSVITLNGPNTIIGRSLIVHANPDDLKTQPTGNAGGRVACGLIVEK